MCSKNACKAIAKTTGRRCKNKGIHDGFCATHKDYQPAEPKAPLPKEECCVCLEENVNPKKKTPCGHAVCRDCQSKLHSWTCPMCRATIPNVVDSIFLKIFEKDLYNANRVWNHNMRVEILKTLARHASIYGMSLTNMRASLKMGPTGIPNYISDLRYQIQ